MAEAGGAPRTRAPHSSTAPIETATGQLDALRAQLHAKADPAKAAIFAAHEELLDDPDLLEIADPHREGQERGLRRGRRRSRRTRIVSPPCATSCSPSAPTTCAMSAGACSRCSPASSGTAPAYPPNAILIAEDLRPPTPRRWTARASSAFARCAAARRRTSRSSRARWASPRLPASSRARSKFRTARPSSSTAQGYAAAESARGGSRRIRARRRRGTKRSRQEDLAHALEPAITSDGRPSRSSPTSAGSRTRARSPSSAAKASACCARSSSSWIAHPRASEDEQSRTYAAIAQAVGPDRPLIIRTLDVGGDKPLAYLPIPREDNPFLGERGIRVGLDRPEVLRTQLRAILRAFGAARSRDVPDDRDPAGAARREGHARRGSRERSASRRSRCGIMVEVPSVAVMAEQSSPAGGGLLLHRHQRPHAIHAGDGPRPSEARAAGRRAEPGRAAAHRADRRRRARHRRLVGVCGGIAGDPQAVPILVGLGVDELSVSLPAIPAVKAQIRRAARRRVPRARRARARRPSPAEEVRALGPE